jgi:hypothetical protein
MPTNHENPHAPDPEIEKESAKLGYEITDIDAGSVSVLIGGLFGFVIVFFFFCYLMGKVINTELEKQDGKTDKWHQSNDIFAGALANKDHKREDLKSNAAMQQQEFQKMTQAFPNPRLETDDGNQDTYELHAREDLLLDHYSSVPGEPIRIPIDRAMQLIASKGLPVSAPAAPAAKLAKAEAPVVTAPLTDGFARTGYELDQIEARHQKMEFERQPGAPEHAELKPVK